MTGATLILICASALAVQAAAPAGAATRDPFERAATGDDCLAFACPAPLLPAAERAPGPARPVAFVIPVPAVAERLSGLPPRMAGETVKVPLPGALPLYLAVLGASGVALRRRRPG